MNRSGIISLVRGDTLNMNYKIYDEPCVICAEPYILKNNDILYFGIMLPNALFENAIIRKKFFCSDMTGDSVKIRLSSDETANLIPGIYYYEIKLRKNVGTEDEEVITTTKKTKFIISN